LGLSIVKEYIELHGGDVKIVNNQESDQTGACFKVRLKR
jgi:signal transduction histidine kinase